jgi:hypothetical protein
MADRVAKSLLHLRDQANAMWPKRSKASDGTFGDRSHQSRSSDHNPWFNVDNDWVVTALDITNDPAHGCVSQKIADALVASRDPRIKYIISNRKICSATVAPWTWRKYTGANPHDKHVHISVKADRKLIDDNRDWHIT